MMTEAEHIALTRMLDELNGRHSDVSEATALGLLQARVTCRAFHASTDLSLWCDRKLVLRK